MNIYIYIHLCVKGLCVFGVLVYMFTRMLVESEVDIWCLRELFLCTEAESPNKLETDNFN